MGVYAIIHIRKIRFYSQLHMRHETSSLFRRDAWLQYVHNYLQNFTLRYLLTWLYLYNSRHSSINLRFYCDVRLRVRTVYTKLAGTIHRAFSKKERCRWNIISDATTTSQLPFIQRKIALTFDRYVDRYTHCVNGRTFAHTSRYRDDTRIIPSGCETIVPFNNASMQLSFIVYKSKSISSI